MQTATLDVLRHQLEHRRDRLHDAIAVTGGEGDLVQLLQQVDSALSRLGTDDYGLCLVCQGHVDETDLIANPMMRYCLCDLSPAQQKALEHDLELATRIQSALLPDPDLVVDRWEAHYRYEPAGPVSGDYCDFWVQPEGDGSVFFAIGDVSGKGVAASLLMAHLQSAFRSYLGTGLALTEIVARVNRQLMAASIPTHYATLVAGRAGRDGNVELVNAGHCLPIVVRAGGIESIPSTGLPVGLFADRPYESARLDLGADDALVLYTDGLSEARREDGAEYGQEGIERHLRRRRGHNARQLVHSLRGDLTQFLGGGARSDDLTILALRRA
jgi:sigma-B regulation protein RsbU (phosphoserine phosphatase)